MNKSKKENEMGFIKKYKAVILFIIAIILFLTIFFSVTKLEPIDNYKVSRTCDFVTVADITGAFCSDGTQWRISPLPQEVVVNQ